MTDIHPDILAERQRQIDVEGWTADHDDEHGNGELLKAAMIYLWHGTVLAATEMNARGAPMGWPWDACWFKPKDRRRNLVRAGALMLAEKERLLRKNSATHVGHVDHKLQIAMRELQSLDAPAS